MRALVVYESMFGSTRMLAEDIAGVLRGEGMSTTLTIASDAPKDTVGYDLVVIGAPTHVHSLPLPSSRIEAAGWAADDRRDLILEPSAEAEGVREWLNSLTISKPKPVFVAFSTRADIARLLTGDAASAIVKRLRALKIRHIERECFLVTMSSRLVDGERDRASNWAMGLPSLAASLA